MTRTPRRVSTRMRYLKLPLASPWEPATRKARMQHDCRKIPRENMDLFKQLPSVFGLGPAGPTVKAAGAKRMHQPSYAACKLAWWRMNAGIANAGSRVSCAGPDGVCSQKTGADPRS